MFRHVYNLLHYEISHAYVHWSFVIRNGNLTNISTVTTFIFYSL